jgi:hypothetical protein
MTAKYEQYGAEISSAFGFQDIAHKNTSVKAYSSVEYTYFSNELFDIFVSLCNVLLIQIL